MLYYSKCLGLKGISFQDGTANPTTQRAYHVDEVKANKELSIDKNFYLAQQIYPVISRLCDPIDGTDAGRIAECLGKVYLPFFFIMFPT